MNIQAEIKGIKYKPFLCKNLKLYKLENFEEAVNSDTSFLLEINKNKKIGVSWWVSPKRTRSYPYARVYNTYGITDKKVTIIPIYKDEGNDGDRDFLQWDTVSLMSLLEVNVIISYYVNAIKNPKYNNKITSQKFDMDHIRQELERLVSFKSSALHWNIDQLSKVGSLGEKALCSYSRISKALGVEMHSYNMMDKKINSILNAKDNFMNMSRNLSQQAQKREMATIQPKEFLTGKKASITIKNFLGGLYHLTVDEACIIDNTINLTECKHSSKGSLPSLDDIKDGLIKMVVFTNLCNTIVQDKLYGSISALKLTTRNGFNKDSLTETELKNYALLKKEAETNNFKIIYL